MQISLQDLKKPTPHFLKATFDAYSRGKIAKSLNVSTGHLINVLSGNIEPSEALLSRMQELAKAIDTAEAEVVT